jgi:hypothetical protein
MEGGIMAVSKGIDWSKIEDLGKISDRIIAKRLGVHHTTVTYQRSVLGIPKFKRGIDWSNVLDLGEVYDIEIAKRLNCCIELVRKARTTLGIASHRKNNGKKKKERENKRTPLSVIKSRWDNIPLLGQIPDSILAKQLGCAYTTVGIQRRRRNIPAYRKQTRWSTVTDLGKIWDTELAKRFNVTLSAVTAARTRLGIPPYTCDIICICCGKQYKTSRSTATVCSKRCGNYVTSVCVAFNVKNAEDLDPRIIAAYRKTTEYMKTYTRNGARKYIDWDNVDILGILSDTEVARIIGCSPSNVYYARTKRMSKKVQWGFKRVENTSDLGKVPDDIIAKRLNLSSSYVSQVRNNLKIPSYRKTKSSSI